MKKIKITLILLFACVCCCILVNLVVGLLLGTSHKAYIPTEGLWYCEAVDIMLSFEEGYSSYFINQGKEVSCIWENDVGSKVIAAVLATSGRSASTAAKAGATPPAHSVVYRYDIETEVPSSKTIKAMESKDSMAFNIHLSFQ